MNIAEVGTGSAMSQPVTPGPGLDPLVALATGMHACPGVYTLLLGSGVSTAAGIPTGWQVVVDLVRRAAAASRPDDGLAAQAAGDDPEGWWGGYGDGEPLGYSSLLGALATTPAARQALLAGYFEPSEEDREAGLKLPTDAHKAIANLVARGSVRVILTTNFDRLLERALEDVGISPQVIHSPEQVQAATPLAHSKVTIVKLHGDYLDLEQRNTVDELSTYPAAYDRLLDRVFDEYGLIVSGWSAGWDHALVAALERRPTRRYPLFWSTYTALSDPATRLIAQHQGVVVPNMSADTLFAGLVARLESLDTLAAPPLTRDMAVARLKRVIHDPARRIEVADLLQSEADRIVNQLADTDRYPVNPPKIVYADFDAALASMSSECDTLLHLLATGVFHDDGTHAHVWLRTVERLMDARSPLGQWKDRLERYRHYPALLAVWVAGLAAIAAEHEDFLARLLTKPKWRPWINDRTPQAAAEVLRPITMLDHDWLNALPRWPDPQRGFLYPASHLLRGEGREPLRPLLPNDDAYSAACDRFECLASLVAVDTAQRESSKWPWMGEFILDSRQDVNGGGLVDQVTAEIRDDWPMLAAFDGSTERAKAAAAKTLQIIKERGRTW